MLLAGGFASPCSDTAWQHWGGDLNTYVITPKEPFGSAQTLRSAPRTSDWLRLTVFSYACVRRWAAQDTEHDGNDGKVKITKITGFRGTASLWPSS